MGKVQSNTTCKLQDVFDCTLPILGSEWSFGFTFYSSKRN